MTRQQDWKPRRPNNWGDTGGEAGDNRKGELGPCPGCDKAVVFNDSRGVYEEPVVKSTSAGPVAGEPRYWHGDCRET